MSSAIPEEVVSWLGGLFQSIFGATSDDAARSVAAHADPIKQVRTLFGLFALADVNQRRQFLSGAVVLFTFEKKNGELVITSKFQPEFEQQQTILYLINHGDNILGQPDILEALQSIDFGTRLGTTIDDMDVIFNVRQFSLCSFHF